jgi:hypothetical protein
MSTITYGSTTFTANDSRTEPLRPVSKRPGLFARLMAARQKQADAELRRHGLRLPRELEEAGFKISARNEDSLPFVR